MLCARIVAEPVVASPGSAPCEIEAVVGFFLTLVDGEALAVPTTVAEAEQIAALVTAKLSEALTLDIIESFEAARAVCPLTLGGVRASVPWAAWRYAVHLGLCYTLFPEIAVSKEEQMFLNSLVEIALP